jgi:D-arginine dehydrogenase
MNTYDVLIIGGGMAGVSLGAELADDRRVGLLDMEDGLSHHTTGRSAAAFLESYGDWIIRVLTTSSREFLENPRESFASGLLTPRALLWLGEEGRADGVRELMEQVEGLVPSVRWLDGDEAQSVCPVLRPGMVECALLEPGASDIDVQGLHQGYVRMLRNRGGQIHLDSRVVDVRHSSTGWRVTTAKGETYEAAILVNAAGAWADRVAEIAGVAPIGLQPLLRSVFMVGVPPDLKDADRIPLTADLDMNFYFKPESGQFLCSPADEIPSQPCDARPDELQIARAIDEIQRWTTIDATHVKSSWGGLRSFTYDRSPIACFEPDASGFFWFAGQGGYGIQTAPALARCAASVVRGVPLPDDVAMKGLTPPDLHRSRFAHLTRLVDH